MTYDHSMNETISVTINHKGVSLTERLPLPEAFVKAEGPQSMESGCMSAVREICQRIHGRIAGGK
jgi:hypothetical protein